MKYSWVYLLCFGRRYLNNHFIKAFACPYQAKKVEFDNELNSFYFDDRRVSADACQTYICRYGYLNIFQEHLQPGEYTELCVTED